jgi:hypothetical protein
MPKKVDDLVSLARQAKERWLRCIINLCLVFKPRSFSILTAVRSPGQSGVSVLLWFGVQLELTKELTVLSNDWRDPFFIEHRKP